MDLIDYWHMAREYYLWNIAVEALQFWKPDLETHVLSSAIEQVKNAVFTQHPCTYYANSLMKYYLVTS